MDLRDSDLDRLLRAAASAKEDPRTEMPFGFDTRIVARWRETPRGAPAGDLRGWVQRIATTALLVTAAAGVGAYWELNDGEEPGSPMADNYAIADTAIETGALR